MAASYFTREDISALASMAAQQTQVAYDKFTELHKLLHRRMRDLSWDLHPNWGKHSVICGRSAASSSAIQGITFPYLRSHEQAQLVERLMGRDNATHPANLEISRHPVIELRLTPDHFAVDFILSPAAWWDQRNLIGKLSVARHRETLRSLIQRMDGNYYFGFWEGIYLSDLHLTNCQLLRGTFLDEWISTFADGHDWLRVGVWYELDDPVLAPDSIAHELFRRIGALYQLYHFALWTSNNNFQTFYNGSIPLVPRRESRL
jgi:hypothetical protein